MQPTGVWYVRHPPTLRAAQRVPVIGTMDSGTLSHDEHPDCDLSLADTTGDGSVDLTDVEGFIECMLG